MSSNKSIVAGRNTLREGLRRTLPAHEQSQTTIPTTVDPAARLAAVRAAAQRKRRHKTKPHQPEED